MDEKSRLLRFVELITLELETDYAVETEKHSDLTVCSADLSPLRLRLPTETPFILVSQQNIGVLGELALLEIVSQELAIRQPLPGASFVLIEGDGSSLKKLERDPYWTVVIDQADMSTIEEHTNPKRAFVELLRGRVPIRFLSPYEPYLAVTGSQFFGRNNETNQILTRPEESFAIFGGRRIGKTSLLKEVRRRIRKRLPKEQAGRLVSMDFWGHDSEAQFYEHLVRHFDTVLPKPFRHDYPSYLPQYIKQLKAAHGGPLVFFLDEVDDLIAREKENKYHLFGLLRKAVEAGDCRLLMAGFRLLEEERYRHDTPLSFLKPLRLSNLTGGQVTSMLSEPMYSLGIAVERDVLPQILHNTGGHPQLVQLYGQSLIEQLDEEAHERRITMAHVRAVKRAGLLYDALVDTLVKNTTDIEYAVVSSLAESDEFSIQAIDDLLVAHGINFEFKQIQQMCRSLESCGFIVRRGDSNNYHFSIPLQPALAHQAADQDFLWRKACRQADHNGARLQS